MTAWWVSDQARLRAEREAITALQGRAEWLDNVDWSLDDEARIRVVFDIRLDHTTHQLRFLYYNTFPSSPPGVAPIGDERLSDHQYGSGGDLCLEIRPDNWCPEYTGADMIESAHSLLSKEAPDETGATVRAPSAHNVPEGISLLSAQSRFYLTPAGEEALLRTTPDRADALLSLHWNGDRTLVLHLHQLEAGDWTWKSPDVPAALMVESWLNKGVVYRTPRRRRNFASVDTLGEIEEVLGFEIKLPDDSFVIILICDGADILTFRKGSGGDELYRYTTVVAPAERGRRSGADYDLLSDRRVGLVGLGSLGSKCAPSAPMRQIAGIE